MTISFSEGIRQNLIQNFIKIAKSDLSYKDLAKKAFHSLGRKVLIEIAKEMGLQPGTYDIRSNKGGIAVSGEVTLHGEHIYIQFCEPMNGLDVLYRTCKGRKDYSGGGNHWMKYDDLLDLPQACEKFRQVIGYK